MVQFGRHFLIIQSIEVLHKNIIFELCNLKVFFMKKIFSYYTI